MQQVTFALTLLQKVQSLLFTAMCFIVKIRPKMIHIQPARLSVTQSLISPCWRSLSSIRLVFWVRVLKMLHVSFSVPHAASVRMLPLSICFWLTACLWELSKRRQVSLNKLMASFIFGVLFFFSPIAENTVVWGLLKSCIQLAHEARNVF